MSSPVQKQVRPLALNKGDCIGVVAPSEPLDRKRQKGVKAGEALLRSLGYEIRYGEFVFESYYYMAGTQEQRASDFHNLVSDPSIKAILTAWGGRSANQLIDVLDYDLIARNPKIFSGFSDTTNLVNAIFAKTGLVTFHGPDVLGKLAERSPENVEYFEKAFITGDVGILPWLPSTAIVRPGRAEGRLLGGNLTCFTLGLMGTPYQPNMEGAIFFWESGTRTPQEIDQYLTYLRLCGVFEQISAMIIGKLPELPDKKSWGNRPIQDLVLSVTSNYNFPIVHLPLFGHGDGYNVTLPIGCKALLDTDRQVFQVLDTCVQREEVQ